MTKNGGELVTAENENNQHKARISLIQGFLGLLTGCVIGLFLSHNHTEENA